MSEAAYFDQNTLLAKCYAENSYESLREKILQEHDTYTKTIFRNGEVYGYTITLNQPLTSLYHFSCYVVKFVFSKIDTLHSQSQEEIMHILCVSLKEHIAAQKGYYTMRVPAHIVDLIRAINHDFTNLMFCGGIVEETLLGNPILPEINQDIEILFPDQSFIAENKETLMSMALKSFRRYQGQYHISPVTDSDAAKIYSQWVENTLSKSDGPTVTVACYNHKIAGYCTISEDDVGVEATLACVNENTRGLGIYKRVICAMSQYAQAAGKIFVTSTQFDNYIVQRAWHSLGFTPFRSIYNMHLDNR